MFLMPMFSVINTGKKNAILPESGGTRSFFTIKMTMMINWRAKNENRKPSRN
jgi:hypothetical protein